jgi:hypothetical protein
MYFCRVRDKMTKKMKTGEKLQAKQLIFWLLMIQRTKKKVNITVSKHQATKV